MVRIPVRPDGRTLRGRGKPFKSGVYEIVHEVTKRRYVGSSSEVEKRLALHVHLLRNQRHHCRYLQNVWTKYGEDQFKFYLIEACPPVGNILVSREQFHMDSSSKYELMNSQPVAGSPLGMKHTEDTKRRLSELAKVRAADPEERKVRSERTRKMHADGRIPYGPRKPVKTRKCTKCGKEFTPVRLPSGSQSNTKWCDTCRPKHCGGYYKTAKHW